jgi:cell shape-determining protein MreD
MVPVAGYLAVVALARILQMRVWQVPLLAMFSVTFVGTLVIDSLTFIVLRLTGVLIPLQDAFGAQTLPSILLNLVFAIPVYAVMRDLAHWTYPSSEAE